jgi:hypothetical protein
VRLSTSLSRAAGGCWQLTPQLLASVTSVLQRDAAPRHAPAAQLALEDVTPQEWQHAMQRANSSLEDFVRSYFMFHELDPTQPAHVFRHLPLLSFVEASIYLLDERNERALSGATASSSTASSSTASSSIASTGAPASRFEQSAGQGHVQGFAAPRCDPRDCVKAMN